jgi:uncharacterized protein DUF5818
MTKKSGPIIWVAALAGIALCAARGRGGDGKTFKGEIADTQCALNVHSLSQSHKEMMEMKPEIKTEAECARFCVKERGGRYVLQTKDKVYKLDAQSLAEPWAGQKVRVVGTLDPKTNMIKVVNIEAMPANPTNSSHPN